MADPSWLWADADTAFPAALIALTLLIAAVALAVRYGSAAGRAAQRFVGRWLVRPARWFGRRWAARHTTRPPAPRHGGGHR